MARSNPAAAPAAPGACPDLAALRLRLNAALIAGTPTAAIRAQIAVLEEHAAAEAAEAAAAEEAAAADLAASRSTAATALAAGAREELGARLAALQPPALLTG